MTLKRFVDSQSEPLDCIIDFMNLMNMRKFLSSDSSGLQVAEVTLICSTSKSAILTIFIVY